MVDKKTYYVFHEPTGFIYRKSVKQENFATGWDTKEEAEEQLNRVLGLNQNTHRDEYQIVLIADSERVKIEKQWERRACPWVLQLPIGM